MRVINGTIVPGFDRCEQNSQDDQPPVAVEKILVRLFAHSIDVYEGDNGMLGRELQKEKKT